MNNARKKNLSYHQLTNEITAGVVNGHLVTLFFCHMCNLCTVQLLVSRKQQLKHMQYG
jgi:hypothetical protein